MNSAQNTEADEQKVEEDAVATETENAEEPADSSTDQIGDKVVL